MDVREKLVELIVDAMPPCYSDVFATQIADHLIANGVTIDKDNNVPSKWVPVTERLPEKHGKYIVLTPGYLKGFNQYDAWLIYYHPQSGFYDSDPEWGDIPMDDVTHWMPLPEPPKGE